MVLERAKGWVRGQSDSIVGEIRSLFAKTFAKTIAMAFAGVVTSVPLWYDKAAIFVTDLLPMSEVAPFPNERIGILIARLDNDPGQEYTRRVRSVLEKQFAIHKGSASVEIATYPAVLSLPLDGSLSENLRNAQDEGRRWLKKQNADLLIWGRALLIEKEIELRFLKGAGGASSLGSPELYPIKIPTKFSDKLGQALAAVIAGTGAAAWNARGAYVSPDQARALWVWRTRLNKMRNHLPEMFEEEARKTLDEAVNLSYVGISSVLVEQGTLEMTSSITQDLFKEETLSKEEGKIFGGTPVPYVEVFAQAVSRYMAVLTDPDKKIIGEVQDLIGLLEKKAKENLDKEKLSTEGYLYLTGLIFKLSAQLHEMIGQQDDAGVQYARAITQFDELLKKLPADHNALSRARIQSLLGETQLRLGYTRKADERKVLFEASIEHLKQAISATPVEEAPRDFVRNGEWLALAYRQRSILDGDLSALSHSISVTEKVVEVLRKYDRKDVAEFNEFKLGNLYAIDGIFRSGDETTRKGLELIRETPLQIAAVSDVDAVGTGAIDLVRANSDPEIGRAGLGATLGSWNLYRSYVAMGDGSMEKAQVLEQLDQTLQKCTNSVDTIKAKGGGPQHYGGIKLANAVAMFLSGDVAGDKEKLDRSATIFDELLAETDKPEMHDTLGRAKIWKGSLMRASALMEKDAEKIRSAVELQNEGLKILDTDRMGIDLPIVQMEMARTLAASAQLADRPEDLKQAVELVGKAKARFEKAGATRIVPIADKDLKSMQDALKSKQVN